MSSLSDQSVVVGGGLPGMSAANTILENGGRVVLFDNPFFCGGNSEKGIKDLAELFTSGTPKGGKKPELAKVLCGG